jgi:hypothetical protein
MRYADLVLSRDGHIEALFEIKEYDVRNPRNAAQLSDYLARVARWGVPFIHVSRFAPDASDREAMDHAKMSGHPITSLRYRDA